MESNYYNIEPQAKNTESRKKTFIISLILLITGILIICINEIINENFYSSFSINNCLKTLILVILGIGIIISIPVFIIYRFKSINIRANGILIISILFLLWQITGFSYSFTERKQSTETSSIILQITNNSMHNKKTNIQTFSKNTYGENAPALELFVKMLNSIVDNNLEYQNQLANFNIAKYMNKEMLSNKATMAKALKDVSEIKNNFIKFQNNHKELLNNMETAISQLNISESYKSSAIAGIDYSLNSNQDTENKFNNIEISIFDYYTKYLNFFIRLKGNFDFKNDTYIFYNDNDLNEANNLSSEFEKLKNQENEILIERETRSKTMLKNLQSKIK